MVRRLFSRYNQRYIPPQQFCDAPIKDKSSQKPHRNSNYITWHSIRNGKIRRGNSTMTPRQNKRHVSCITGRCTRLMCARGFVKIHRYTGNVDRGTLFPMTSTQISAPVINNHFQSKIKHRQRCVAVLELRNPGT